MKRAVRKLFKTDLAANVAGWCAAHASALYLRTLRVQMTWEQPNLHPLLDGPNAIFCTWHENILLWAYMGTNQGISALASDSADGKYLIRVLETLGFRVIRGSSSRGAVRAVREMVRESDSAYFAITPDGPRGPRQQFQAGAVFLASRAGLPLVPTGYAYERPWRVPSWDRFVIPRPFSRAVCYGGPPIHVPSDAGSAELAEFQKQAGDAVRAATLRAERLLAEPSQRARFPRLGPGQYIPSPAATVTTQRSAA